MMRVLRWIGFTLAGLVALGLLAFGAITLIVRQKEAMRWDITPAPLVIPTDSASIARGEHLAVAIAKCTECHGEDMAGRTFLDGMPFGRFTSANVTPGGAVRNWSDGDWVRAVRNGVAPDGRGLIFMPSEAYAPLSSEDLGAILAWVKQLRPVSRASTSSVFGPIGKMLWSTGKVEFQAARVIDQSAPFSAAPPAGPTAEYGKYLSVVGGCTSCHGPSLAGGIKQGPPGTPPSANLTPAGLKGWTEADLFRALREGRKPDGSGINPFMPWLATQHMTDDEIRAMWNYLQTIPAVATS
jgi:mono/diheme cytochrome c family protein